MKKPASIGEKIGKALADKAGKAAADWALDKVGLGSKKKEPKAKAGPRRYSPAREATPVRAKRSRKSEVREDSVERAVERISAAGGELGRAGMGVPKTLTAAQRAFRKGQAAFARSFRWS